MEQAAAGKRLVKLATSVPYRSTLFAAVQDAEKIKTVEGDAITARTMPGTGTIDSGSPNVADVVKANVEASNGIAHVIDDVWLPPAAQEVAVKNVVELATSVPDTRAQGGVKALRGAGRREGFARPGRAQPAHGRREASHSYIPPWRE